MHNTFKPLLNAAENICYLAMIFLAGMLYQNNQDNDRIVCVVALAIVAFRFWKAFPKKLTWD